MPVTIEVWGSTGAIHYNTYDSQNEVNAVSVIPSSLGDPQVFIRIYSPFGDLGDYEVRYETWDFST